MLLRNAVLNVSEEGKGKLTWLKMLKVLNHLHKEEQLLSEVAQ